MKRYHIAIFTHLGNGHVYPTLGLCAELTARGHRVTYATDESHAPQICLTGAEPVIFRAPTLESGEAIRKAIQLPAHDPNLWIMYATLLYPGLFIETTAVLSQLSDFYSKNVPDLIIYDRIAFVGRILAKQLCCAAVQTWPHFAFYGNCLIRDSGICLNPEPMIQFGKLLDFFLSAYGIDDKDNLWHSERLNIYFVPRAFQYCSDTFDQRSCFVGACLNRPFTRVWRNTAGNKPIILVSDVTCGTDSEYFRMFVEALSESQYHVILSIGESLSAQSLGALPANFELNRHASHLEILPHAALVICQAGMGSTLESIYYGVPVIAVPLSPLHEEVAYRLVELGLGIRISRDAISREVIKDSVEKILDDGILISRVKQMQQVFRESGGAHRAANCIEYFMECGRTT